MRNHFKEIGLGSTESLAPAPQKGERWAPSHQKTIPEEDQTVRGGIVKEEVIEASAVDKGSEDVSH